MTSTPWLDGLITRAIQETYAHQCWLLSPQVQEVLLPLMTLGDPVVVWKVAEALTGPVWVRRLLALGQRVPLRTLLAAEQDLPGIQRHLRHIKDMLGDPEVADYSPGMLAEHLAHEMIYEQEAGSIMAPIMEVWRRIPEEDPLIALLDPWPRPRVARREAETVLMALLAAHFKQYTGAWHYKEIAEASTVLFSKDAKSRKKHRTSVKGRKSAQRRRQVKARILTAEQVRDRVRKWNTQDLTPIWQALKINFGNDRQGSSFPLETPTEREVG